MERKGGNCYRVFKCQSRKSTDYFEIFVKQDNRNIFEFRRRRRKNDIKKI